MNLPKPPSPKPGPSETPQNWRRRTYRPDLLLAFLLALLPCLFFWRLITPNPADRRQIMAGDFTEQYFPLRAFAAEAWVQGQIPLWNPYLYGGQPALADIQSGALYPPHIIEALLLGWIPPLFGQEVGFPIWALEWQVIFHFSIAAVGSYLFVWYIQRKDGVLLWQARFGAVIASLSFTYSGYLTGFPVQQMTILAVSAWLPWIMWGLAAALGQDNDVGEPKFKSVPWAAIAWTALALAMAILAGHPQTVLYIFYLTLAYALFKGFCYRRNRALRHLVRSLIYALGVWLGIILLGVSISAAQLLPTLQFISHSLRADLSYQAVSAGLPLTELIAILYPGFFGGSPQYIGIVPLVLAALALRLAWSQYKMLKSQSAESTRHPGIFAPSVFFWVGAGLVSLLLAFGNHLFVYPLFYLLVPGFDMVRQQERAFLIYSFSAAIIAGYGAALWVGRLPKELRQTYALFEHGLSIIAGLALVVTPFFIYGSARATARGDGVNLLFGVLRHHLFGLIILGGVLLFFLLRRRRWLRRPWGMGLIAGWLTFNLFTVNWHFNLAPPPDPAPLTPTGLVQFLQNHLSPAQTLTPAPGRVVSNGLLPGGNNAASVFNLHDLTGNTPLQLATAHYFLEHMPAWRLWQLMNVRYVVDRRDIGDPGLRPVFEEAELKVFEMADPFEHAWLVSTVEIVADEAQAIERLASADFDLRRMAVVTAELVLPLSDTSGSAVTILEFSPTTLTIDVKAAGYHLLILSQIYYPGWQAKIDGQPADLLRVNMIQQGLVIPPGQHVVRFRFHPNDFITGVMISAAGLLVCAALFSMGYIQLK